MVVLSGSDQIENNDFNRQVPTLEGQDFLSLNESKQQSKPADLKPRFGEGLKVNQKKSELPERTIEGSQTTEKSQTTQQKNSLTLGNKPIVMLEKLYNDTAFDPCKETTELIEILRSLDK
ncbi:MAG: hypothetical protein ACOZAR_01090 [Patescibacteria group bacterium]